jgi:hypothetical protein
MRAFCGGATRQKTQMAGNGFAFVRFTPWHSVAVPPW